MAEKNLCKRLGILEENEDVTEATVQQFVSMFALQVPSNAVAALRALFRLDCAHATSVDAALLSHGVEVKPGESLTVSPQGDHLLHLSQGALGKVKKYHEATMFVKVDDRKLSIGTLSTDKFPHVTFDLVFKEEFELSHTSKSSSVFFSGYKVFHKAEREHKGSCKKKKPKEVADDSSEEGDE
ncbi:hypothetical protein ACQ4PT_018419 [Festuca glaucescens]